MGIIMFNGRSSRDVGLEVETFPQYEAPQKVLDVITVPGRNGDLVIDTGTFKNVPRTYAVSIATRDRTSYSQTMSQIAEWLYSANGYTRLEDSYDEDYYRIAYYGDQTPFENLFNEAGKATLTFVCKPQRYFKSGEFPILYESAGKIQNGTRFSAFPLLKVVTDNTVGSITIGNYAFEIAADAGTHVNIDCDIQEAYYGAESKNNYINLNGGDYPRIDPGEHIISFTGGIQSVEVIPRWWTV